MMTDAHTPLALEAFEVPEQHHLSSLSNSQFEALPLPSRSSTSSHDDHRGSSSLRQPMKQDRTSPQVGGPSVGGGHSSQKGSFEKSRGRRKNRGSMKGEENHSLRSTGDQYTSGSEDVELDNMSSEGGATDDEETGLTGSHKRRRQAKKERNTLTDERVVPDPMVTKQEKKLADIDVLKKSAINAILIGLWYTFSLSISIYNKWMFSPEHLDFRFPLFTTSMHMLVQFTLASVVLFFMPRFRPRPDGITNPDNVAKSSDEDEPPAKGPLMTAHFYLTRIGPCGAATGLDIGLGNMSLKFITLTFFTMCKSSALAFVLLFAFVFRLETPSIRLILIIATMTVGVIMMVAGETSFNILGFILIISSAFFSGFRWALTQILLLRNPATSNPFSTIFFLSPIMFLTLLLLAIPVEGFADLSLGLHLLTEAKGKIVGILLLLFPGVLAFCMTSSEFALLQRTSVVTLSICGIFKEVITISAAGIVFHDRLTPVKVSGLLVTIASIAAYNYLKISKMRHEARQKLKEEAEEEAAEQEPMLESDAGRAVRERTSTSSFVMEVMRASLSFEDPRGRDQSQTHPRRSPTRHFVHPE